MMDSLLHPRTRRGKKFPVTALVAVASVLALGGVLVYTSLSTRPSISTFPKTMGVPPQHVRQRLTIFVASSDEPAARKQRLDLAQVDARDTVALDVVALNKQEQSEFVQEHCVDAVKRYGDFQKAHLPHLAAEVWKYCSLIHATTTLQQTAAYLEAGSPLLVRIVDWWASQPRLQQTSVAVLSSYVEQSIHGSFLVLRPEHATIAQQMLKALLQTDLSTLQTQPLLLPRTLYNAVAATLIDGTASAGDNDGTWYLLQQSCQVDPLRKRRTESESTLSYYDSDSYRLVHTCPSLGTGTAAVTASSYCCAVVDSAHLDGAVPILLSQHPVLPIATLPSNHELPLPYNKEAGHYLEEELPFIATVTERVFPRPSEHPDTPNFYDVLMANDCLPSDDHCSKCLRNKAGATCESCLEACPCYCKTLCHETVDEKFVHKEWTLVPPVSVRDGDRLVPRIVHQTWFEELTPEKYPNMSRLQESFKESGWQYKFWNDDEAANFLSTHFPAEVRQAYDALIPGAFKADLFRYCVLLIHGGIYADVDILLETSLDSAVLPDIGFMAPIDEPGTSVHKRFCLWNGMIAATPAHPFLAKAIEIVVNQVRNRFTSVDVDATFCPDPEMSILHAFDTLHTAGPCVLGSAVNRVLGRHGQTALAPGDIDVGGLEVPIPGRAVILHQNKWDMGAHRFTLQEQNLVVAATDLPDSNDRESLDSVSKKEHYSKAHAKTGIYGVERLYTDKIRANEDIRINVASTPFASTTASMEEL